jgi:hypothetical protein
MKYFLVRNIKYNKHGKRIGKFNKVLARNEREAVEKLVGKLDTFEKGKVLRKYGKRKFIPY